MPRVATRVVIDELHDRIDKNSREARPHGRRGDDLTSGAVRDRSKLCRANGRPQRVGTGECTGYDHGVAFADRGRGALWFDEVCHDLVALEHPHHVVGAVVAIDHADLDPERRDEGERDLPRPAIHGDHPALGPLSGEMFREVRRGRVTTNTVDTAPQSVAWFERREQLGTQPPQRTAGGMPFDDSSAGQHQIGVTKPKASERGSGLCDQLGGIGVPGTCQITQVLDRMHFIQRSAGLLPFHPWQPPPLLI